jgi:chromosome segregation ATPase
MEPNITVQTIEDYETSMFKDLLACPFDVPPISKAENKYIDLLRSEIDSLQSKLKDSESKEKTMAAKFKEKLMKIKSKQKTIIEKLHRGQNFEQQLRAEITRLEIATSTHVNKITELETQLLEKSNRLNEAIAQEAKTTAELSKQRALAMKLMSKQAANNSKLVKYKSFEENIEKEFKSYSEINIRLESALSELRHKATTLESQLQASQSDADKLRKLAEQYQQQLVDQRAETEKYQSANKKEQKAEKWKSKYIGLSSEIAQINQKAQRKLRSTAQRTIEALAGQQESVVVKLRNLCDIYENPKSE